MCSNAPKGCSRTRTTRVSKAWSRRSSSCRSLYASAARRSRDCGACSDCRAARRRPTSSRVRRPHRTPRRTAPVATTKRRARAPVKMETIALARPTPGPSPRPLRRVTAASRPRSTPTPTVPASSTRPCTPATSAHAAHAVSCIDSASPRLSCASRVNRRSWARRGTWTVCAAADAARCSRRERRPKLKDRSTTRAP